MAIERILCIPADRRWRREAASRASGQRNFDEKLADVKAEMQRREAAAADRLIVAQLSDLDARIARLYPSPGQVAFEQALDRVAASLTPAQTRARVAAREAGRR